MIRTVGPQKGRIKILQKMDEKLLTTWKETPCELISMDDSPPGDENYQFPDPLVDSWLMLVVLIFQAHLHK